MTPQQIQEAQHYLNRMQELDKEITEISKKAELIVSGHAKCSFSMLVTDVTPVPEKISFNEHGDIISGGVDFGTQTSEGGITMFGTPPHYKPGGLFESFVRNSRKEQEGPDWIAQELTDNTALQILGILLEDKMRRKQEVVGILKKMGVE